MEWQIQNLEVGAKKEEAIVSTLKPVHYSLPSEIKIAAICNFSEDERWFASDVYICLLSTHLK